MYGWLQARWFNKARLRLNHDVSSTTSRDNIIRDDMVIMLASKPTVVIYLSSDGYQVR